MTSQEKLKEISEGLKQLRHDFHQNAKATGISRLNKLLGIIDSMIDVTPVKFNIETNAITYKTPSISVFADKKTMSSEEEAELFGDDTPKQFKNEFFGMNPNDGSLF